MSHVVSRWLHCFPLHGWALCGVIAWGWMTLWWVLLWEIGGVLIIQRDEGLVR